MKTVKMYITDKSKKEYFVEFTGEAFTASVKRDLERHLVNARLCPIMYTFLDLATAVIIAETV